MNTDQITLSPAKRARRCVLNLLVCLVVAVGAYAGFHSDRWPFKGHGAVTEALGGGSLAAFKSSLVRQDDAQTNAPVQISMAQSIASAYLVIPGAKPE